jgi:PKD repeat protein
VANGFSASHSYAAGGNYRVTATVTDAHGGQSVSTTTITVADFGVSITRQNGMVTANTPASYVVSVTPVPQLEQPVTLACSGLPAGYSCAFSPATLTPGSSVATTNLRVSATSASAAKTHPWLFLALSLPVGFISLGAPSVHRTRAKATGIACLLVLTLVSCGGGSLNQSSAANPGSTSPTPANSVTFTVTGAVGTLERSVSASFVHP